MELIAYHFMYGNRIVLHSGYTSIAPQLHHERGIGRRSDDSSGKADNRQPFQTRRLLKEVEWDTQLLCVIVELFLGHNSCSLD